MWVCVYVWTILPDVILDRVDDDLFQMVHYPVALDIFVDN